MKTRNSFLTLTAGFVLLALASAAHAHAFLDHADPKVGSKVDASPEKVTLKFTQEIEPSFSSVTVNDSDGKQIDKKDVAVDSKDASVMTVSVPSLAPGTYRVEWKVTSVDTHKTHGSFTFTVKPKG